MMIDLMLAMVWFGGMCSFDRPGGWRRAIWPFYLGACLAFATSETLHRLEAWED